MNEVTFLNITPFRGEVASLPHNEIRPFIFAVRSIYSLCEPIYFRKLVRSSSQIGPFNLVAIIKNECTHVPENHVLLRRGLVPPMQWDPSIYFRRSAHLFSQIGPFVFANSFFFADGSIYLGSSN